MPIAINSEHNDLADSVRSLVAKVAPSDVLHEALETPISNPPPYWRAAAEQGLQGVHLSEKVDGQGFGILELAITLAEFGYGAVPGPFVPSAIASALIAAHDGESALLNGLATGDTIAAIGPGPYEASIRIDAADRVVVPGFIDLHSHADFTVAGHPAAETAIAQGVTTVTNFAIQRAFIFKEK